MPRSLQFSSEKFGVIINMIEGWHAIDEMANALEICSEAVYSVKKQTRIEAGTRSGKPCTVSDGYFKRMIRTALRGHLTAQIVEKLQIVYFL